MNKILTLGICLLSLLVIKTSFAIPEDSARSDAGEINNLAGKQSEGKPLRFISDLDTPPFAFVENFQNVGFEIDLGEAIGKEMGRPVEWLKQSFNIPAMASSINSGRADAVLSSMTATKSREQYFNFTRPYFRTSLAVAAPRDVDWNSQNFRNGLTPKIRVGVLRRSTGETWAIKNLKATRKTYSSPSRLARALRNGEVEIILIDMPILKWELANRHYKFKIVEEGIDSQDYGIAIGLNNKELLDELNATLEKLDADGVYDMIYEKWYTISQDLPALRR